MKCQGKRCESSTDLPTVWWMKPIEPQNDSGRIGSKKKLSQDTGLISLFILL